MRKWGLSLAFAVLCAVVLAAQGPVNIRNSSGAELGNTAAAPFVTRLSDGSAFYKALVPSDTLTKVSTVDTITNTVTVTDATPTTSGYTEASVSFSSSGDNTVVSGTAMQTVRVFRLLLVCASTVTTTIKDGAATSLTGAMTLGALVLDESGNPWFQTSSGNAFVINLGSGVQCSGKVSYTKS